MTKTLKIRVRKTPYGRHLYTAHVKACGWYGWGNTPAEARAKLLEIMAREGLLQAATDLPPCEQPMEPSQMHCRYPSGWCVMCGAAPEEGCKNSGGPTEDYPDRATCKPDQSCCDFTCGN